jgi:hypothetical protein
LGCNNGLTPADLWPVVQTFPNAVQERVRIVSIEPHEQYGRNVGYLKAQLCLYACQGVYLVELDHDDELTPDALEQLKLVIDASPVPVDFLYSDSVHIHDATQQTQLYSGRYGWREPYGVAWGSRSYLNNAAFPLSAASLHDIFYAPDHVRVWRRAFYEQIGGHDPQLAIADDHDLLQRTYIAGGEMVQLPACLYIYHLHEDGSNTYLQRNAAIQQQQAINGDRHRAALIEEWCRRESLLRVELGGGQTLRKTGVLGVALRGADLEVDVITHGLPFKDNSVGCITAQDFLEHIPHCRDSRCQHRKGECVVGLMNEIHRVLAPNGWFLSSTPSSDGRGAFQDPTHCSFWNENSFWYYTRPEQARFVPGLTAKFICKRLATTHPSSFHVEHHLPYVSAVLIALKQAHQPGDNLFWVSPAQVF